MHSNPTPAKKRKPRRWLRVLLALLLLGVAVGVSLVGWVTFKETHLPEVQPSDVILVLGAQVKPDGSPSKILQYRLEMALQVYQEDPQFIITCGAQGSDEPAPEGEVMRDWLLARGVSPAHVFAETSSFNTRENLQNAQKIMVREGLSQALVITSDYHVPRALELCRQVGISATGIGSQTEWPYWAKNHIRESLSWVKLWLEGWL